MLLKDVLHILSEFSGSIGFQQGNLYVALFDGAELEDQLEKNADYGVDDIAKKYFSGRPLKVRLAKKITSRRGFGRLCRNIRENYLDVVGGHDELFRELSDLLKNCTMTEKVHKDKLIDSCDGTQPDELARFIAACIVCGNFNATEHKKATGSRLSLEYMELDIPIRFSVLEKQLWTASQHEYIASHGEGNRFHSLNNIIQKLLPSGYFTDGRFDTHGRLADGTVAPLVDLCEQTKGHIAIIGEGGIGKTTFLQYLLQNEFMASKTKPRKFAGGTIPFFVELNRCPAHIAKWYSSSLQKTDFITRYVAIMLEDHSSLDTVQAETLDKIEKEFQKHPEDGKPEYLLLLDGFNEVLTSDDQAVRTYLSNEITVLSQYPNVRIITTSRETQSAYYAADFENIYLVGLEDKDIIRYLEECGKPETFIGEVMNCKPLVQCLRVLLYLCMFSAEESEDNFLPETPGEILYCFFHRNSAFYNARRRVRDSRTSSFTENQIAFVLDFVLPYIGWQYEESGVFSLNKLEFENAISEGINVADRLLSGTLSNPFPDFNYSGRDLKNTIRSFQLMGVENAASSITNCVHAFLGIVYEFQINEGPYGERNRYAFCHHHFRDYFSAIWDVQLLSMLQCITVPQFEPNCGVEKGSYHSFLNNNYWQHQKADFVSQILMEHRNRPRLNVISGNWEIPSAEYDEQMVLTHGLDFCRQLCRVGVEIRYLLQNILTAILNGGHELSGLDLRRLDFKHCSLFNVTCSRRGRTDTLAANFDGSKLYPKNFAPEEHQDAVMEYVYHGNCCFTIDDTGLIKCWDVRSGKMEYELRSDDPLGLNDFSAKGFIKISKDDRWLATKIQVSSPDGVFVAMNLFDITDPEKPPKQIVPPQKHSMLNFFNFTEDSCNILFLCDRKIVYCFDIATGELRYRKELALDKFSELYAISSDAPLYIFTANYDVYDEATEYLNDWDAEVDEDDGSRLLITSQYQCLEYDLERGTTRTVALSGENERLAVGYYVIPEMPAELYRYFVYQSGDLGITGPEAEDGFQTCWITRGFFLESLDKLKNLLEPECYKKVDGQFVPVKKTFQPYESICVRHTNALAHQKRYGASGITFMHLGDTLDDEVVFSEDTERLSYQSRLRGTTYNHLKADFERNIGGGCHLYWDYAIPWIGNTLIACHSFYNLMPINRKTGLLSDPIEYTPGVAISGCCFWDVQADNETRNLIANNGGIIGP